jgi:hypothetical protein
MSSRDNEFSPPDLDCHVTLPKGPCSCNSGQDITLLFRSAPSTTARGHFRQIDPLPTLSACPLRSDRVRTFAPQRIDAVCQCTKSLRDSGGCGLAPVHINQEGDRG